MYLSNTLVYIISLFHGLGQWCKTDDNDIIDEQVNDSECHKCKSDGPWEYSYNKGICYAYCFNTPSGKKDWKVVDDDKCDDKPSDGGDYFLAVNEASYGDLCIKGSDKTRLRPCNEGDSKQVSAYEGERERGEATDIISGFDVRWIFTKHLTLILPIILLFFVRQFAT